MGKTPPGKKLHVEYVQKIFVHCHLEKYGRDLRIFSFPIHPDGAGVEVGGQIGYERMMAGSGVSLQFRPKRFDIAGQRPFQRKVKQVLLVISQVLVLDETKLVINDCCSYDQHDRHHKLHHHQPVAEVIAAASHLQHAPFQNLHRLKARQEQGRVGPGKQPGQQSDQEEDQENRTISEKNTQGLPRKRIECRQGCLH